MRPVKPNKPALESVYIIYTYHIFLYKFTLRTVDRVTWKYFKPVRLKGAEFNSIDRTISFMSLTFSSVFSERFTICSQPEQ